MCFCKFGKGNSFGQCAVIPKEQFNKSIMRDMSVVNGKFSEYTADNQTLQKEKEQAILRHTEKHLC